MCIFANFDFYRVLITDIATENFSRKIYYEKVEGILICILDAADMRGCIALQRANYARQHEP